MDWIEMCDLVRSAGFSNRWGSSRWKLVWLFIIRGPTQVLACSWLHVAILESWSSPSRIFQVLFGGHAERSPVHAFCRGPSFAVWCWGWPDSCLARGCCASTSVVLFYLVLWCSEGRALFTPLVSSISSSKRLSREVAPPTLKMVHMEERVVTKATVQNQ